MISYIIPAMPLAVASFGLRATHNLAGLFAGGPATAEGSYPLVDWFNSNTRYQFLPYNPYATTDKKNLGLDKIILIVVSVEP